MTITKTHTGHFTQGQAGAIYILTVSNVGDLPTTGTVTVVDALPDLTATAMSGSGWTCTLSTATCTRADALAAGAAYPPVTLTATVSKTAPATIVNTASVSGGGEANTSNSQATDPTQITQLPDLSLAITDSANFSQGGSGATYTISVINSASVPTTGTITVTDTLPPSLTATAISGQGWNCVLATVTCTSTTGIGPYLNSLIYVTTNVALNAPSSVTNTAVVSGGGEINAANDTATDTTPVGGPQPDFTVSISHPGTLTEGQTGVTYTLTAKNIGAAASSGIVYVVDSARSGLNFTAAGGTGWTCKLSPDVSCQRSDALAATSSYPPITLTADVLPSAPNPLLSFVNIQNSGDINQTNNTVTDSDTIKSLPDLIGIGSHSQFVQGQTGATYFVSAYNVGGVSTTGAITLTDSLPAGLTATGMGGVNWNCTLATFTCSTTDQLPSFGISNPITLTVNVDANAPASVSNTLTVSGGGETFTSDNTATDPTSILPAVSVTVQNSSSMVTAGHAASYSLMVSSFAPDAVVLSCKGLPALATCSFNPSSLSGQGASATLTIATTAPTRSAASPANGPAAYILLLPLLGLLMIRKPALRTERGWIASAAVLLGLLFLAGCGGSSAAKTLQGGTPAGSYTVTITAADAGATFQGTTTVPLSVNWNGL